MERRHHTADLLSNGELWEDQRVSNDGDAGGSSSTFGMKSTGHLVLSRNNKELRAIRETEHAT